MRSVRQLAAAGGDLSRSRNVGFRILVQLDSHAVVVVAEREVLAEADELHFAHQVVMHAVFQKRRWM